MLSYKKTQKDEGTPFMLIIFLIYGELSKLMDCPFLPPEVLKRESSYQKKSITMIGPTRKGRKKPPF